MLGGLRAARPAAGTYDAVGARRRPARRHGRRRGPGAGPRSAPFDQVGPVAVPLLAARRHGRADAGQRLPALGHDGEGRRLPRRPASPRPSPTPGRGGRWCVAVGLATMVIGGWRALRQYDLKRLLAFGTVSQLGFLVVLFGAGHPRRPPPACVVLLAHALFKARAVPRRRHHRPPGPHPRHPAARRAAAAGCAARGRRGRGRPRVDGRHPAAARLRRPRRRPTRPSLDPRRPAPAGSCARAGRPARCSPSPTAPGSCWGAFGPTPSSDGPATSSPATSTAPAAAFWPRPRCWPCATVAARRGRPSLARRRCVGPAARRASSPASGAAGTSRCGTASTAALGLSGRHHRARRRRSSGARARAPGSRRRLPALGRGQRAYDAAVAALNLVADRRHRRACRPARCPSTSASSCSPAVAAARRRSCSAAPTACRPARGSPAAAGCRWPVVILAPPSVAVAVARRRFAAVLLLGAVGYGVALLFVLQGAPDLALTQLLVETLSRSSFVLVLRHLPARFADDRSAGTGAQAVRWSCRSRSACSSFGAHPAQRRARRVDPPISDEFIDGPRRRRAARNVVNVILVDFRGLRHHGRDHRARRRRHGRGRARRRRPAPARRRRRRRGRPRRGGGGAVRFRPSLILDVVRRRWCFHSRAAVLGVPALHRPQPPGRRLRRRAGRRARALVLRYAGRRHRRGAARSPLVRPGRCSAPGCHAGRRRRPCCRAPGDRFFEHAQGRRRPCRCSATVTLNTALFFDIGRLPRGRRRACSARCSTARAAREEVSLVSLASPSDHRRALRVRHVAAAAAAADPHHHRARPARPRRQPAAAVSGGRARRRPRSSGAASPGSADPMPQALALTAIVISFGVTAFLLALAYRQLAAHRRRPGRGRRRGPPHRPPGRGRAPTTSRSPSRRRPRPADAGSAP